MFLLADLEKAFLPYTGYLSSKVPADWVTQESRGFGYVNFETKAQAQEAMDGVNGTDLKPGTGGMKCRIDFKTNAMERRKGATTVFVKVCC